jgi:hypothetical protein
MMILDVVFGWRMLLFIWISFCCDKTRNAFLLFDFYFGVINEQIVVMKYLINRVSFCRKIIVKNNNNKSIPAILGNVIFIHFLTELIPRCYFI